MAVPTGPCDGGADRRKAVIFEPCRRRKSRVENGQIKIDEPTDLPNGTELYVVSAQALDDVVLLRDDGLDASERKRLHAAIRQGIEDGRAGRVTDFDDVLVELEAQP